MRTYSACFLCKDKYDRIYWVTNWGEYKILSDINFDSVLEMVQEKDTMIGYGYMYGYNSRNLVSDRCRTVLYLEFDAKDVEIIK
jgi:hypothetical protein